MKTMPMALVAAVLLGTMTCVADEGLKLASDLNSHYGLKLKVRQMPLSIDEETELKSRPGRSRSFAYVHGDFDFSENTDKVTASVTGMVNGKGGMSISV